jgi:AraC family transcriptional regulator
MRVRVPGDLSVFPETTARQIKASTSHEVLVVRLSEGMLAQSVPELRGTPIFELHPIAYLRDTRLEHICRALKAEAEADYVSGSLYGEWLGLALGARLAHLHSAGASLAFKRGGIAPRTLARVIDFIDSNLDSPLRMSALAEVAGLSEYRFAHNFKSAIGFAPHQYVMRARLERAKRLLRETDSSVLEIACEVGCPNLSRFNSLFRRETGTLPTIYRASFRQLRKA